MKNVTKYQAATTIAILFNAIGLAGILFFDKSFFIRATSLNLLLMALLLIFTQQNKSIGFWIFFISCFVIGIGVEIIGISTGFIFGNYVYGDVLGKKVMAVPLIIGINWFIIIYCCGTSIHMLLTRMLDKISNGMPQPRPVLKTLSIIIDGATLAVIYDLLMEPAAVKLGYWIWKGDAIPLYNYICWFLISCVLLLVFHYTSFNKENKFAVNLLLIQAIFFLIIRTFL